MTDTRDELSNDPRDRGRSPPQPAVTDYDEGQSVHLSIDPSVRDGRFHPRFNGHTGVVVGEQGDAYQVEIVDGDTSKTLIVGAAHMAAQADD